MTYDCTPESLAESRRFYARMTADLRRRLTEHNNLNVTNTLKPAASWVETDIVVSDDGPPHACESNPRSAATRAFARKRR